MPPVCCLLPSRVSSPWPPPVSNFKTMCLFPPHSLHIQQICSLCHHLFMHYTSFLNNLPSHLSIFPPLPPSISTALFFCLALSVSPLYYLNTCPQLPPRLTSYLPFCIPSSFLFPSFFSIFPPSVLLLCALYHFAPPSSPLAPHKLKLNPVGVSLAWPRIPLSFSHMDPRNRPWNTR